MFLVTTVPYVAASTQEIGQATATSVANNMMLITCLYKTPKGVSLISNFYCFSDIGPFSLYVIVIFCNVYRLAG